MAPARMVAFMRQHIAECPICLGDPFVRQEIERITEIIMPANKFRPAADEEADADSFRDKQGDEEEDDERDGDTDEEEDDDTDELVDDEEEEDEEDDDEEEEDDDY